MIHMFAQEGNAARKAYAGSTALILACFGGHIQTVQALLADPRLDSGIINLRTKVTNCLAVDGIGMGILTSRLNCLYFVLWFLLFW